MGKKLGQHFLVSAPVLDDILAAAHPAAGEPVLEVGPGTGALTERLLKAGARLCAVELDPALAEALRNRWDGHPGFRLIEGDVLKLDLSPESLFGEDTAYAVTANLPYYLSTPLLFRLAAERATFTRLVLMLQWEVARRMVAGPEDGKAYGSLSVAIQHAFVPRLTRRVPPGAFRPPPKVESAVVTLTPLPFREEPGVERRFFDHVKDLFTRRRKLMLSGLKPFRERISPAAWARVEALVGGKRAENLTPAEHFTVFMALHSPEFPVL